MRSCLNTLQFIKNKSRASAKLAATQTSSHRTGTDGGGGLTVEALTKSTIGRKDQHKSLFSVWEEIFQATYARKTRSALKVMEEGREGLVKGNALSSGGRSRFSSCKSILLTHFTSPWQ